MADFNDYRAQDLGRRDQTIPTRRHIPPPVHEVFLNEDFSIQADGTQVGAIVVDAVTPTYFQGRYEIWMRDPQANVVTDWQYVASTAAFPFTVNHPDFFAPQADNDITNDVTIAVVSVSGYGNKIGPEGSPQATLTLRHEGVLPPDIPSLDVSVEDGMVLFDWTSVDEDSAANADHWRSVYKYEIRAGATGWLSGTYVGSYGPRNRRWGVAPRSKAPGSTFMIKAVNYQGTVSDSPASASLTAAEESCLDNTSPTGYQEVTIPAGFNTLTVTTVCPYAAAPFITAAASDGSVVALATSGYSQNGDDTWSFTLTSSMAAPPGGTLVHVMEAGAH